MAYHPKPPWAETRQRGGYLLHLHRPGRIAAIARQPFEFDADPLRRAGLEADAVNVSFRVGLGEPRPPDHDFHPTRSIPPPLEQDRASARSARYDTP